MKIDVYNQKGEKSGTTLLPKEIFEIEINPDLVHQVMVSQMANRRKIIAHAKDRSEVRGGGRKPWRQKGTGRARHGSIRSPLWKGGGVTFGPTKERVFKKQIPSNMKRKALFMVLSGKLKENLLVVLDELSFSEPKTKIAVDFLRKIPIDNKSCLIGLSSMDKNTILSIRNVPKTETIQVKDLNCLDLLLSKYFIITEKGLKVLKEHFIKEKKESVVENDNKKKETKKVEKKNVTKKENNKK